MLLKYINAACKLLPAAKNMWICSGWGADILSLCKIAQRTYSTNLQEFFSKENWILFCLFHPLSPCPAPVYLKKISSSLTIMCYFTIRWWPLLDKLSEKSHAYKEIKVLHTPPPPQPTQPSLVCESILIVRPLHRGLLPSLNFVLAFGFSTNEPFENVG